MIKTIAAATAAAFVSFASLSAHATDLYTPAPSFKDGPIMAPAPIWTGFYAGVHLGAGWTDLGVQHFTYNDGYGVSTVAPNNSISATGFGGGQFGYNWQLSGYNFVLGAEVDLDGIGGNNERSATAVTYNPAGGIRNVLGVKVTQNGGFAGDVTGRLGYACGSWLLYAKGGFAWFGPNLEGAATVWSPNGAATLSANNSGDLTGWTVGAGLEWMLNPQWSVKAEYLYYDFGVRNSNWNVNTSVSGIDNSGRFFDNDLTINTVKLGLNYHLASGYTALK